MPHVDGALNEFVIEEGQIALPLIEGAFRVTPERSQLPPLIYEEVS